MMRNTSRRIPTTIRIAILKTFLLKLKRSGYPDSLCQEVLESGLKGYFNMVEKELTSLDRVNRPASQGMRAREANKMTGKATWFLVGEKETADHQACKGTDDKGCKVTKTYDLKSAPKDLDIPTTRGPSPVTKFYEQVESVIFVPATPMSSLCKQLQRHEDTFCKLNNSPRVRFIERVGNKLITLLCNKDPWSKAHCGRQDCWCCSNEDTQGQFRHELSTQ